MEADRKLAGCSLGCLDGFDSPDAVGPHTGMQGLQDRRSGTCSRSLQAVVSGLHLGTSIYEC